MQYLSWTELSHEQKSLLETAKENAEKSVSQNGHKVGCAIHGAVSDYVGSTISHPRIIGSTCAERMAIDNLLVANDEPSLCAVVGKLNRDNWTNESLCTPCGLCLEMFWELQMKTKLDDIEFVCANWDLDKILSVKLSELFPRFEAVRR
jgi:cytidine deaminase